MATMEELTARLWLKFKDVPNVQESDVEGWLVEALERHGVPNADPKHLADDEVYLIMLLGRAEGARSIAMSTAHFFSYTDGDESIDKSGISEHWHRMAQAFDVEYRRQIASKQNGVKFNVGRRIDRDYV